MGLFVASGPEVKGPVDAFYSEHQREARLDPSDWVVGVQESERLLGVVRLCFERGFVSLRSMQVRPELQRQGVGSHILRRFAELLVQKDIRDVYCMPYAHLESFYGQIGFVRLTSEEESLVPELLWKRLDKHRNRKPNSPVILMRRKVF